MTLRAVQLEAQGLAARRHVFEYAGLALIVLVAIALRVVRLDQLTLFAGDEGRDATIIWHAVLSGQLPSLGTSSSIGTWSRGPASYLLMMPAFFLAHGDPVAGALTVAAIDIGAVIMLFVVGRAIAGGAAGLTAAAIWSVAPVAVWFGRFMWNPQLVPFFTLLAFYSLARLAADGRWLVPLAASWSIAWQCHDEALLVAPSLAIGVLVMRRSVRPAHVLAAAAAFLLTLAPYALYELRHGWPDILAMAEYVVHGSGVDANGLSPIERLHALFDQVIRFLPPVAAAPPVFAALLAIGAFLVLLSLRSQRGPAVVSVSLWLPVPLLYVFWRGQFDAAYLLVVYPLAVLLIAVATAGLARSHIATAVVTTIAVVSVVGTAAVTQWDGLVGAPVSPWSLESVRSVTRAVRAQAGARLFAFDVVSAHSSGSALVSPPYWHDYLRQPFAYLLDASGPGLSSRADIDTFVLFDPPTLAARYADAIPVGGFQLVHFPAPTLGPDLLPAPMFGPAWTSDGAGTSTQPDGDGEPVLRIDPLADQTSPYGRNVTTSAAVEPSTRYVVSFRSRGAPPGGTQRVYAQIVDASGTPLLTRPTGGGEPAAPSAGWIDDSFVVDIPPNGTGVVIYLRNTSDRPVYFRAVELRRVLSSPVPGALGE